MTNAGPISPAALSSLRQGKRALRMAALSCLGIAALTASSKLLVPLWPVPMTMQTYMVLLIGGLCGPWLGSAIVLAWLGLALAGLPLLAGSAAGPAYFIGPTGGYLLAFPVACFAAGLFERHAPRRLYSLSVSAAMLGGHAICLLLGWAWLAAQIGAAPAYDAGIAPFLAGSALKSLLAAASLLLARQILPPHSETHLER